MTIKSDLTARRNFQTAFPALILFSLMGLVVSNTGCASLTSAGTPGASADHEQSPAITSTALPAGTLQVTYNTALSATGGTAPYSWRLTSGQLPTGLTLSPSGAVVGMPTQVGTSLFSVKVKDSSSPPKQAAGSLSISISSGSSQLQITTISLASGQVGSAYSVVIAASGGITPYSWSQTGGTLPPGLGLDASGGQISGTPTQSGTFPITVQVKDSSSPAQTASQGFSIVVAAAGTQVSITTSSVPNGQVGAAYSTTLAANGGTAPYTWSISASALPTGLVLGAGNGIISGTPSVSGSFSFTAKVSDSTSPTKQTATESFTLTIASAGSTPVTITTSSVPNGQVGAAYSTTLAANGGTAPYTWSISAGALPTGLVLGAGNGIISGTPSVSGSFSFTAKVSDSTLPTKQIATKPFSMTVSASVGPGQLTITNTSLADAQDGQPYSVTLSATGGTPAYTWSITVAQLPPGLTLGAASGQISGTPSASGQFNFTVQVTDSSSPAQMSSQALSITVSAAGQFDPYGGLTSKPCSGGPEGFFYTEKANNRWWFCTPDGNRFWMVGVFDMATNPSITDMGTSYNEIALAKYGDLDVTWGPQQVRRIKSWGFNSVAEFSSKWTMPTTTCNAAGCGVQWLTNGGKQPVPVPMVAQVLPSLYSLYNVNGYAPAPVKDTMYGINRGLYVGYWSSFVDFFDPNFDTWLNGEMRKDSIAVQWENSPWTVAWISDECDELNGLCGAGPDLQTNPPSHNQRQQALMTLMVSPVQVVNPGDGRVLGIQLYSNTTVFSKAQLQSYLQTKYATIAALNAAWGSTYTTFGSTGTQVTGETISTGNGTTTTFTKTLANPNVSPYSIAVKVNGILIGGDCPHWVPLAPCSGVPSGAGSFTGPLSASPAISANPAGQVNYATGTLTINFATAPANGAPITVDYIHDGWNYGTGVMDEDGRNLWIPADKVNLGSNASFNADMNGFLSALATEYFSITSTRIRQYAPHNLFFGPGALGTWDAPASKYVLQAAAPFVDGIATTVDPTRTQLELNYNADNLGDKPLILWVGEYANADSALWRYHAAGPDCNPCQTQAERGTYYTNAVNSWLNTANTTYNDTTIVGFRWWALTDSWGEKKNWGLITLEDNPYDGAGAVIAPGIDAWGYPTGGEEKNYGNFLGPVRTANQQWINIP